MTNDQLLSRHAIPLRCKFLLKLLLLAKLLV
jgi:hypothetical protein